MLKSEKNNQQIYFYESSPCLYSACAVFAVNGVLFKLKNVRTVVVNQFSPLQVREHEQNCSENVSASGRG